MQREDGGYQYSVNTVYLFSQGTAGFSGTGGGHGMRFVGILDDDVSANQCRHGVWTEGY